jgi:hypothetical protein
MLNYLVEFPNKTRDWVNAEKVTINVFGENFNEKEVMKTRKKRCIV